VNGIYALIIAIGFLPLAIVLYKINTVRRMKKSGVKAIGTIRDVPYGSLRQINKVLIEYIVKETGNVIIKDIPVAGRPYQVGDKLPLYYDRNNPNKMQLDSGKNFIFLLLFTLFLAIFFIIACFMIYKSVQTGEI